MDPVINPADNAELYRKKTVAINPLGDHIHLQCLNVFNDERVLLGAADLTGRFWCSSLWIYENCSTFEKEEAFASVTTESVICDAAFIDKDKFLVAEDSGAIQVLSVVDDRTTSNELKALVQCLDCTCQHDDAILSLSVFDDKTHFVTAGMDCCIKVWTIDELLAKHSYGGAHRKAITCVDAKPKNNDIFISSSLDCEAVLWDSRKETAAEVIYSVTGCELQAVAWSQNDEYLVAVGGSDGTLTLLDSRRPGDFLAHSKVFTKPIHKLKYDSKRPHLLAVCCDDSDTKVVNDRNNFATVYHDERRHSDFVRGISWYKENLLTCSWDNTVVNHEIPSLKIVE